MCTVLYCVCVVCMWGMGTMLYILRSKLCLALVLASQIGRFKMFGLNLLKNMIVYITNVSAYNNHIYPTPISVSAIESRAEASL